MSILSSACSKLPLNPSSEYFFFLQLVYFSAAVLLIFLFSISVDFSLLFISFIWLYFHIPLVHWTSFKTVVLKSLFSRSFTRRISVDFFFFPMGHTFLFLFMLCACVCVCSLLKNGLLKQIIWWYGDSGNQIPFPLGLLFCYCLFLFLFLICAEDQPEV